MTFLGIVHYSRDYDWDTLTPTVGLFITIGLKSTCDPRGFLRSNDGSQSRCPSLRIVPEID